jgi:uncharacterized membrane protein
MDKRSVLSETTFGMRVAEEEGDELKSYFVETEQWRKILAGDVDVVYGPKGSGQSAIYSLLNSEKDNLRTLRRIVVIPAENPRGTPAFRDLVDDPPASEDDFRSLWKLYLLSLLANYLRRHYEASKKSDAEALWAIDQLVEAGLIAPTSTLRSMLKAALDYVRHRNVGVEGSVSVDPVTGVPRLSGRITLSEPSVAQRNLGFISTDDLFEKLNSALERANITVWLVLDRLDVAFAVSQSLERNALRALFRSYLDILAFSRVGIKIFLRDDIWRKILSEGFREASHITRTLTISWDAQSLLNLIVRRALHNDAVCSFYAVEPAAILANAEHQNAFFYRMFPPQVDVGQKQTSTLEWMLSRIADSSRRPAPRELIHLLAIARDAQLRAYELGGAEPAADALFDKAAIKAALPEVSKVRFEQTLCAENADLKPYLDRLEGEKTQQNPATLSKLWNVTTERAAEIADRLTEIGFFEKRGSKEDPIYWVPFLYREALNLVQGAAE